MRSLWTPGIAQQQNKRQVGFNVLKSTKRQLLAGRWIWNYSGFFVVTPHRKKRGRHLKAPLLKQVDPFVACIISTAGAFRHVPFPCSCRRHTDRRSSQALINHARLLWGMITHVIPDDSTELKLFLPSLWWLFRPISYSQRSIHLSQRNHILSFLSKTSTLKHGNISLWNKKSTINKSGSKKKTRTQPSHFFWGASTKIPSAFDLKRNSARKFSASSGPLGFIEEALRFVCQNCALALDGYPLTKGGEARYPKCRSLWCPQLVVVFWKKGEDF